MLGVDLSARGLGILLGFTLMQEKSMVFLNLMLTDCKTARKSIKTNAFCNQGPGAWSIFKNIDFKK